MARRERAALLIAEAVMADRAVVTVELFGMPRYQARRTEVQVPSGTAAEVLAEVVRECPSLKNMLSGDGRLAGHYLLSVDGRRFLTDLDERLPAGTHLLLLSADAGG